MTDKELKLLRRMGATKSGRVRVRDAECAPARSLEARGFVTLRISGEEDGWSASLTDKARDMLRALPPEHGDGQ